MDCHYASREKALSTPRKPEKTMGRPQESPAVASNMGYERALPFDLPLAGILRVS